MISRPYVSLCIPTNGIVEWVIPVLESIYNQNCNINEFEVVITDNGNNKVFENAVCEYAKKYSNLVYKKTSAKMFLNQIEAFKLANGILIKFLNHRMLLVSGGLEYLIQFSKDHMENKPVVYFSNGVLGLNPTQKTLTTFDEYVGTLSYWSSWSAGTAVWKESFDKMNLDIKFNELFPHTDIVFSERKSHGYIVDDKEIMHEIDSNVMKKGHYDLFHAFCVEYPNIIISLHEEEAISKKTRDYVLKQNRRFVSNLYFSYVVRKNECPYDLTGYKKSVKKYYSDIMVKFGIFEIIFSGIIKRLTKHGER